MPSTRQTLEILFRTIDSPIMLIGVHGSGKSEMVAQCAETLGLLFIDVRLSQFTEGDLLGVPYKSDKNTTRFFPPDRFQLATETPCLLFLDELNRATREVRQAVFQLADSGRIGSLQIHKHTKIVSAINPDNGAYEVNSLDPAELDRWFLFKFQPSVDEWLQWGAEQKNGQRNVISNEILDYIRANQDDLDPVIVESQDQQNGPSRRSWKRLDAALAKARTLYPSFCGNVYLVKQMFNGFLGEEIGKKFFSYFIQYQKRQILQNVLDKTLPIEYAKKEDSVSLIKDIETNGLRISAQYESFGDNIMYFAKFVSSLPKEMQEPIKRSVKKHCTTKFNSVFSVIMAANK